MKSSMKTAAFAAASAFASQPCLGAVALAPGRLSPVSTVAATPIELRFNLASVGASNVTAASMSMAASQQTALEATDQPKPKGIRTGTLLIVGGVILAVALLAAVAGATPTPGPREGAFD